MLLYFLNLTLATTKNWHLMLGTMCVLQNDDACVCEKGWKKVKQIRKLKGKKVFVYTLWMYYTIRLIQILYITRIENITQCWSDCFLFFHITFSILNVFGGQNYCYRYIYKWKSAALHFRNHKFFDWCLYLQNAQNTK